MTRRMFRPRAALTMATAYAAMLALGPAIAETPSSARSLDLGAATTAPAKDGLIEDFAVLLEAAQHQRRKGETNAPNKITTVRRVADALRAHEGVAFVALAERKDSGDEVALQALYVLEGSPVAPGGPVAKPTSAAGKGAVFIDLDGEKTKSLRDSLENHLGALLGTGGARSGVEEVVAALKTHAKVSYVVLAGRGEDDALIASRVFVVPDVLRISISDEVADGDSDTPEVEIVEDPAGGPPLIKFEFDPKKYLTD